MLKNLLKVLIPFTTGKYFYYKVEAKVVLFKPVLIPFTTGKYFYLFYLYIRWKQWGLNPLYYGEIFLRR